VGVVGPTLAKGQPDVAGRVDIDRRVHGVGVGAEAEVTLVRDDGVVDVANVDHVPTGIVLVGADANCLTGDDGVVGLRGLEDASVGLASAGNDDRAVRVLGIVDIVVGVDAQVERTVGTVDIKDVVNANEIDRVIATAFLNEPHGVAGRRVVHGRRPV